MTSSQSWKSMVFQICLNKPRENQLKTPQQKQTFVFSQDTGHKADCSDYLYMVLLVAWVVVWS